MRLVIYKFGKGYCTKYATKRNIVLTYPAIDNTTHIVKFMNNTQFNFNPAILADVTRSSEYVRLQSLNRGRFLLVQRESPIRYLQSNTGVL